MSQKKTIQAQKFHLKSEQGTADITIPFALREIRGKEWVTVQDGITEIKLLEVLQVRLQENPTAVKKIEELVKILSKPEKPEENL